MTTATNPIQTEGSTFTSQFGVVGFTASVRGLTKTLVEAIPRHRSILSLRADVMAGKKEPVKHLLRLSYVAIDLGVSVEKVTQWAVDFIAAVKAYAARREQRQSSGILPVEQVHVRLVTRSIREDCEADVTTAGVDLNCAETLETARTERLEAIAQDERLVEFYTNRLAELRTR